MHQIQWQDHDRGWLGDHSKGVYVSKHVDYTFFYSSSTDPFPGDEGIVVMLELVTGRVCHFNERNDGVQPSPGKVLCVPTFYPWPIQFLFTHESHVFTKN